VSTSRDRRAARRRPRRAARARAPREEVPRRRDEAPAGRARRGGGSETLDRVLWALPWGALAITIIVVGGAVFAGVLVVIGAICLAELGRMARRARPLTPVAVLATAGLVAAAYWGGHYQILLAFLAAFPVMFVAQAARGEISGATGSFALTTLGIAWIGLPIAHAVLLRELPDHGAALLVDVLVATIVADTAAYAGGRLFGRRPLAPSISPNKTVEGLAAGLVGGAFGFWFAGLYQDWLPGLEALAMGAVVAIVAVVGDLFESLIKRDLGVKDSGTAVGPHGGLLDRLDSVLFAIVAGYYLAQAFVY